MSQAKPLKGLNQVISTLTSLGKRIETQAIRSGMTAGAAIVREDARQRAPKETGQMAKAIVSGSPNKREDGTIAVRVYVDERKPDGFLGFFHEYGVASHLIASTGAGQGRVGA